MKWVISLAVFILFACRCSSLSPSPPVDVFTSGEGGYMCIRIPVILETPQGLIAMAEGRGLHSNNFNCCVSPVEDFPYCNDKDIVMKVSKDDGNTWTPLIVVFETGADYFYSNPSPVFHSNYMYMVYTRCSIASNYDDCTVFFGYSTFDNQWNVIQNFNTPPIAPLSGPGSGIIDSGQTMLFPITTSAGTYVISTSAQSPSSLSAGGFVPPQGTAGESQITQLPDGRLVIQIRGPTSHWISYSSDNGTTWSSATVLGDLPATNCEASLFYSSTLDLLLYSTPADNENNNRSNVTIYLSSDSGVHFSPYVLVYNGPSAYSSLFQNSNGTVGVLFERGVKSPYEAISLSYLV